MHTSGDDLRDKILAKYLDGEIDDPKLDRMLALIDNRERALPRPYPIEGYQ